MVIVLVLFGGKKLPELMGGLGKGWGQLQKGLEESKRTLQSGLDEVESHAVHEIVPRPAEHTLSHGSEPEHLDEAS